MAVFHQDEKSFWKTTNISRLWSLLDAYYQPGARAKGTESIQTGKKASLSEYLITGGG